MNVWKVAILKAIQALGGIATNRVLYQELESGRFISLSAEDLRTTKWDKRPAYQNQVRSHLSNLVKTGDLKREQEGVYAITPLGKKRIKASITEASPKRSATTRPPPQQFTDRRNYQRFKVASETLALSPKGTGRIIDICSGGFSAEFYASGFARGNEWETNLMGSGGSLIVQIPIKIAHVTHLNRFYPMVASSQKVGFQFREAEFSDLLRSQLKYFIKYHTEQKEEVS